MVFRLARFFPAPDYPLSIPQNARGIRGFKATLRKAPERLETLRTPEGLLVAPNTRAELRRDMARLRLLGNIALRLGDRLMGGAARAKAVAVLGKRRVPTRLKGPPSFLVQLRSAVWTGDTRDTRAMSGS